MSLEDRAVTYSKCPIVSRMGKTVNEQTMPFVWLPNKLPFYVTSSDKLKVICDESDKIRAHRVEHNAPYFKEKVRLVPGAAGASSSSSSTTRSAEAPLEAAEEAPFVEAGTEAESPAELSRLEEDEWIDFVEPTHFLAHMPKSLACEICCKAKLNFTLHRQLKNQSAEKRMLARDKKATQFLDHVMVDHAIWVYSTVAAEAKQPACECLTSTAEHVCLILRRPRTPTLCTSRCVILVDAKQPGLW